LWSVARRASHSEHRTSHVECCGTSSIEHRASSVDIKRRASTVEQRVSSVKRAL
jgi:hypothetical protein